MKMSCLNWISVTMSLIPVLNSASISTNQLLQHKFTRSVINSDALCILLIFEEENKILRGNCKRSLNVSVLKFLNRYSNKTLVRSVNTQTQSFVVQFPVSLIDEKILNLSLANVENIIMLISSTESAVCAVWVCRRNQQRNTEALERVRMNSSVLEPVRMSIVSFFNCVCSGSSSAYSGI